MSMLPSQAGKTSVITKSSSPKVGMVSLGCAKALVDSERIITQLKTEGYDIAPDYKGADIVLVNTCGFLDSARAESLDAIGEAMAENGKVIVTGCLGAEPEVIRARFPHVLDITGPQQYESVMKAVHKALPPLHDPYLDIVPPQGVRLTPRHYAYLKISEGCNNRCSFCIIPSLRGDLVSRTTADILDEAEKLVASGVRELLIISQDTSAYGVDIKYAASNWRGREVKANLVELCKALSELGVWVRLHYVYPYPSVDAVITLMRDGLILPYLDIPFQHASPAVLKNMRRPANQEKTAERINKWREICPSLTLRSTFIVGFPGETEEDFSYLLNWLKEVQIDRLGCFKYEDVKGAPSHHIEGHVSEAVKQERYDRLMALQQEISAAKLLKKIGTIQKVLVDEIRDGKAIGRSATDAPDIDGCIIFSPQRRTRIGEFAQVEITDTDAYDMYGIESVTV